MEIDNDKFEALVKAMDENIEDVTTCLAEHEDGTKENGLVLTVKGVDVVLLASQLQEIVDYLEDEDRYMPEN